jgi:NAD(P)-dependent dehydrogenase (short-subunit alcohol dehydrogenase family)
MEKTVLITGSSTGIGRAAVIYFQEKGWNVIATMRTPEKEEELTQLENVLVTRLDVTDLDSINRAVQAGIEKFGKIDVVVNNAGYGAYGPLEAFPRENILRQFNTNVIGLLDVTRALLPHFRENKEGVLINISSVGGKVTFPFGALYHGTKFAVEGITESLTFELEQIGCKAKIVEPGSIATDFGGRSFDFQNNENIPEYQPMVKALLKGLETILSDENRVAPPPVVAEVIYQAATDGTNKLRYTAGYDAEMFLSARRDSTDEEYIEGVKSQFGF